MHINLNILVIKQKKKKIHNNISKFLTINSTFQIVRLNFDPFDYEKIITCELACNEEYFPIMIWKQFNGSIRFKKFCDIDKILIELVNQKNILLTIFIVIE